jgi:hypothetical protein
MKLVDIAHSLLKMAPYDQECIKSKGLQKYMNQVSVHPYTVVGPIGQLALKKLVLLG